MRIKERFAKATIKHMVSGGAGMSGIAIISSGTTVASVTATDVKSGDIVMTNIYMYGAATTVAGSRTVGATAVMSVRAGAFEIVAVGSLAPSVDMPVAWTVFHR